LSKDIEKLKDPKKGVDSRVIGPLMKEYDRIKSEADKLNIDLEDR